MSVVRTISNRQWPFKPLRQRSYSVIVIDPPWHWKSWTETRQIKATKRHYKVMELDAIKALPVAHIASRRGCIVYLWATAPMLTQAIEVMKTWGVTYKSTIIWRKVTRKGKQRMGLGFWARTMHEQVLIGTIGKPHKPKAMPSLFDGLVREHSRKPDEFYDLVKKHTPRRKRADVFSRENRDGFDCCGHEAGKFNRNRTTDRRRRKTRKVRTVARLKLNARRRAA